MSKVRVNEGYELYQIITDFGDPLEIFREGIQNSFDEDATQMYIKVYEQRKISGSSLIIDIIDNGNGLLREKIASFFDVANSSKITEDFVPNGKHGYKGHGSKVFFNADEVHICSKTENGDYWAVKMEKPIEQIAEKHELHYSDFMEPSELGISLPNDWVSGFCVRIIAPRYFGTQYTRFKLNHIYLRDYCRWYSIIGTIETAYNEELKNKNIKLYLCGLLQENFQKKYKDLCDCDPVPKFVDTELGKFEEISLGHYFPDERVTDTAMKKYAKKIGSNKASYMFYSKMVYNETITTGSLSFKLIINLEGYETKRRYDLLLSKQGRASTEENHTDGERYGLWACKGGVPVEKVDDWLVGGKGVGSYTYMQAFIDCDDFQLTANRGSIRNTDIEKLDLIKKEVNKVFKSKRVNDAMQERQDWELMEKTISSIDSDAKELKKRYNARKTRKKIILPDGTEILDPTKNKSGYSESETFVVLLTIMEHYPDLFKFSLLDYNTTKGIDFVVDVMGSPKYIELKGTLTKKINHPFRLIYKFICYDLDVAKNEIVEDIEPFKTTLKINKNDNFESNNEEFNLKPYTSFCLQPEGTATIQSMEIINLKTFLVEVLGVVIE